MPKHLKEITREEWFASEYAGEMFAWLCTASGRKLRLFACSSCQQVWDEMSEAGRELVIAAELWADSKITRKELQARRNQCEGTLVRNQSSLVRRPDRAALATATPRKDALGQLLVDVAVGKAGEFDGEGIRRVHEYHRSLLHDIFDHLFLAVTIEESWRTPTVIALALGIYEEKAFGGLPILADALQDAGCDNEDILSHCRSPGPHVRGCWVVDLVLGKE